MRAKPYIVECYRYDSAADDGARQVERFHLKQVGELPAIAEAKGLVGGADFFKVMDGGRVIHDSRQGG